MLAGMSHKSSQAKQVCEDRCTKHWYILVGCHVIKSLTPARMFHKVVFITRWCITGWWYVVWYLLNAQHDTFHACWYYYGTMAHICLPHDFYRKRTKGGYLLVDKVAPCSTSSAPFIVIHQPTNYTMVVPLGLSLYGIFWNIVQWPSNKSNNVHIMVNATRIYMYVQDLSQKVLIKTGAQNIDTNNW